MHTDGSESDVEKGMCHRAKFGLVTSKAAETKIICLHMSTVML